MKLIDYCQGIILPSSVDDPEFVFSSSSLQPPATKMSCDSLVITRGNHGYGHTVVPVAHIQAPRETYRELGILFLATVFHRSRVELALTHAHTDIKNLVLEEVWIMSSPGYYDVLPHQFTYWPEERPRHPWTQEAPSDMPCLEFGGAPYQEGDEWTLFDSSCDRGRVMLGKLLLDIGREVTAGDEYHLEGEMGFRGTGPGSAEISLWLPDSFGWHPHFWETE